jgi:hypothetical protein
MKKLNQQMNRPTSNLVSTTPKPLYEHTRPKLSPWINKPPQPRHCSIPRVRAAYFQASLFDEINTFKNTHFSIWSSYLPGTAERNT